MKGPNRFCAGLCSLSTSGRCIGRPLPVCAHAMHACMRQVHVVFVKIPSNFGKSALAAEPVVDDNKDGTYNVRFTARELPCHAMPCHFLPKHARVQHAQGASCHVTRRANNIHVSCRATTASYADPLPAWAE